jgi:hypothetical protein
MFGSTYSLPILFQANSYGGVYRVDLCSVVLRRILAGHDELS